MKIIINVLPVYKLRETIREVNTTLRSAADQTDDITHAADLLTEASEIIDTLVDQIEDHCTGRPELRA